MHPEEGIAVMRFRCSFLCRFLCSFVGLALLSTACEPSHCDGPDGTVGLHACTEIQSNSDYCGRNLSPGPCPTDNLVGRCQVVHTTELVGPHVRQRMSEKVIPYSYAPATVDEAKADCDQVMGTFTAN